MPRIGRSLAETGNGSQQVEPVPAAVLPRSVSRGRTSVIARERTSAHVSQIDGIRGIAVLAVVLYHFAPTYLPGGFVGVDVFFVVSGFLIGGILWREYTETGTVKLGAFLLRRARRLAPAYFVMAAAVFAVAYMILLPFEFREFGKSLIASLLYLSNVQFFREAGYFDIASEQKALLHTWSLSVEEQFYLVLPTLLLLLGGRRGRTLAVLAGLFALSLFASIVVTPRSPVAAFYLFPFRAWELLLGVLLAIVASERRLALSYGPVLSIAGLALIALGFLFVHAGDGFPGFQVLLPTIGTALLIANLRDRNPINTTLAAPALVYFGLISYSLYLWHWPILTLSQYYLDGYAGGAQTAVWLALSLIVATLSWRFVERPIREMRHLPALPLAGGVVMASTLLLCGGALAYLKSGMPDRFGPDVRIHVEASADFLQNWNRCAIDDAGPFVGVEVCQIGAQGQPSFVVWGDSHVRAFKEGIDLAAREQGTAGLLIWRAGCPALFGIEKRESAATPNQNAECSRANEVIRKAFLELQGIDRILLVGRWAYYAEGRGVGDDDTNTIDLWRQGQQPDPANQADTFSEAVRATVAELSTTFPSIYVLKQVPEIPLYDSRAVARRLAHGSDLAEETSRFVVDRSLVAGRTARSESAFGELATAGKISWLDLNDRLCGTVCSVIQGEKSYYFDNNHLTNSAALALRDAFLPVVSKDHFSNRTIAASLHER